jgi:hypothetical protein|eukprot:SAG25_NODE_8_length_29132_cov_108.213895_16_plen_64_part_00
MIFPFPVELSNVTLVPLANSRRHTPSAPLTASALGLPRGLFRVWRPRTRQRVSTTLAKSVSAT